MIRSQNILPTKNDITQKSRKYIAAMSLGFNMVAGMAVFSFLGYYIDQKRGGGQAWTLFGIFLGLFYCGYEVWKLVRQTEEDARKQNSRDSNP